MNNVHPLFQTILRPYHSGPTATLAVMQQILRDNLDAVERLDGEIADLSADLRDIPNDWAYQSTILKITAARERQRQEITKAARNLRTVEALRCNSGMDSHVLARIFAEFNRGEK